MSDIKVIQWYPNIIILWAVLCKINSETYLHQLPVMACGCGGHRQYLRLQQNRSKLTAYLRIKTTAGEVSCGDERDGWK